MRCKSDGLGSLGRERSSATLEAERRTLEKRLVHKSREKARREGHPDPYPQYQKPLLTEEQLENFNSVDLSKYTAEEISQINAELAIRRKYMASLIEQKDETPPDPVSLIETTMEATIEDLPKEEKRWKATQSHIDDDIINLGKNPTPEEIERLQDNRPL